MSPARISLHSIRAGKRGLPVRRCARVPGQFAMYVPRKLEEQVRAAVAVNRELVMHYRAIGTEVIDNLGRDLMCSRLLHSCPVLDRVKDPAG